MDARDQRHQVGKAGRVRSREIGDVRLSYLSTRLFDAIAGLSIEDPDALARKSHGLYAARLLEEHSLVEMWWSDSAQRWTPKLTAKGEDFAASAREPSGWFRASTIDLGYAPFGDTRLPRRFWMKTIPEPNSGCWIWLGSADRYGGFGVGGLVMKAHRVAFIVLRGAISDELELDHKCRNTLCVNPAHLEAVTHAINVQRGDRWAHQRSAP